MLDVAVLALTDATKELSPIVGFGSGVSFAALLVWFVKSMWEKLEVQDKKTEQIYEALIISERQAHDRTRLDLGVQRKENQELRLENARLATQLSKTTSQKKEGEL